MKRSDLLQVGARAVRSSFELWFTCAGESVPVEEQLSSRNKKGNSESALVDALALPPAPLSDGEKSQYEALITDLYQQLDDKVGLT